jgi:hypothetical protein
MTAHRYVASGVLCDISQSRGIVGKYYSLTIFPAVPANFNGDPLCAGRSSDRAWRWLTGSRALRVAPGMRTHTATLSP